MNKQELIICPVIHTHSSFTVVLNDVKCTIKPGIKYISNYISFEHTNNYSDNNDKYFDLNEVFRCPRSNRSITNSNVVMYESNVLDLLKSIQINYGLRELISAIQRSGSRDVEYCSLLANDIIQMLDITIKTLEADVKLCASAKNSAAPESLDDFVLINNSELIRPTEEQVICIYDLYQKYLSSGNILQGSLLRLCNEQQEIEHMKMILELNKSDYPNSCNFILRILDLNIPKALSILANIQSCGGTYSEIESLVDRWTK